MKPTVISKEYLALQTDISDKQIEWTNKLEASTIIEKQPLQQNQVPIIAQLDVKIDYVQYKEWLLELADYLVEKDENLLKDVTKIRELLSGDVVKRWGEEALAFNQLYFQSLAEEADVQPWLPYLLAEHCLRPFLRIVSEVFKDELPNQEMKGSCPCCGEPVRIAVLEGKGKKMIVCPRCEAKWQQKRLQCSFCGNEDHKKLSYYTVEKDQSSKIEVCSECNNYTKIIDTRKLFKKQTTFLLDVNSIHLDIVAQENGFGVTKGEVNN